MTTRMAAVLKHWREASTLILVTARHKGANVKPNVVSSSTASAEALKGANFDVLLLKRSAKSKFMPNRYVFPGGVASDVDFSADWIPVFDLLGKDHRQDIFDFVQRGGQGAPMFSRLRDAKFSQIPSEIAFRICAIRETFEESGVLIAHNVDKADHFQPQLWEGPSWASYCEDETVINEWRQKVDKDPSEFLRMCQELRIVPDVWSLYEWSNWLTPLGLESNRRYDTAFFVCCVGGRPHAAEDEGETVHSQWASPYEVSQQYYQANVNVAPPQMYETRRLMQFCSVPELLQFAWHLGQHRVERWMPVVVATADTTVAVLPGDSLYPEDVDLEDPSVHYSQDKTLAQLAVTHPNMHRTVMLPDSRFAERAFVSHVVCNITQPGGHVSPQPTLDEGSGQTVSPRPKL